MPADDGVPEEWRPVIINVVHRLVIKDYQGLIQEGLVRAEWGADEAFADWIEDYPDNLVELPDEAWSVADFGKIETAPNEWWLVLNLWTELGRSDLSLEGTIFDDGKVIRLEVDNVHVL